MTTTVRMNGWAADNRVPGQGVRRSAARAVSLAARVPAPLAGFADKLRDVA